MADDTAIRATAQRYIDRGWAVIALYGVRDDGSCMCHKGAACGGSSGKHPVGAGRLGDGWCPPIGSVDELRAGYNIGLLTGSSSGFFVLDVDPKNGGDARLAELVAQYGPLPVTLVVRTGSGGVHYYFQLPDDFTPTISRGRLPVGLDIRGEGGQVVAPPSVSSFGAYTDAETEGRVSYPIAPAPAWLLELIRPLPPIERPMTEGAPAYASGPQGASGRGAAYAAEAVQRVTWELRMATPGDRNNTAFKVACRLVELAYADWSGLSMDDAWAWYASAGRELVGPDFPEGELRTCWRQAIKEVRERPAVLPPPPGGAPVAQTFADWGGMPPFSGAGSGGSTGIPGPATAGEGAPIPHQRIEADPWGSALPPSGPAGTSPAPAYPSEVPPAGPVSLRSLMLVRSQLSRLPRPEPLIQATLWRGMDGWLIGASGSGKSFIGLDWACHIATGRTWNERRTRQGPVIYVVCEGASGIQQRVDAWELAWRMELDARRDAGEVVSDTGTVPDDLIIIPASVRAFVRNGRLLMPSPWFSELVQIVGDVKPALVGLDTQARMTLGLNENDNAEMSEWTEAVARLRSLSPATCNLVVHHTGRNNGDARGASSIDGAQDFEWKVKRTGDKADLTGELILEKHKDGADGIVYPFRMKRWELGWDAQAEEQLTSLTVSYEPFDQRAARAEPLEHERDFNEAQQEIAYVLREVARPGGDTRTEIRRMLHEIRKQKAERGGKPFREMAKSTFNYALDNTRDVGRPGLVQLNVAVKLGEKYADREKYEKAH